MKAIATEATERSIPAEDALRLVIDTTPALIHTGRPDGYLDYFNRRWLEFFGLPLEEVCGWRWTDAVHPEDVAGLLQKWHAALASGEPLEAEARVRRADGEYRLLLHRKVPLRDERGAILKWYGSSIDIEDRKRAQERILQDERERRSEALLAEAQRLTRIGSFVFRLPDATEYWSPESFQIFGIDPAKGHPRNMSEYTAYVHPDDREWFLREAEEILANSVGEPVCEEGSVTTLRRHDPEHYRAGATDSGTATPGSLPCASPGAQLYGEFRLERFDRRLVLVR